MKRFKRKLNIFRYRSIRDTRDYLSLYSGKDDLKYLILTLIETSLVVGGLYHLMKFLIVFIFGTYLF